MTYRAGPPPAVLVLRPAPAGVARIMAWMCPLFVLLGLAMIGSSFAMTEKPEFQWSMIAGGALTIGAAVAFGIVAYRMSQTRVHLIVDAHTLQMEWRRGSTVTRMESIPRGEVVDVAIDDLVGSGGGETHRVVVGTRNGDIPLVAMHTGARDHHVRNVEQMRDFLRVPIRG